MPNSSADRELLPLSYIAQYGYCPRRCALLMIERVWSENEYTAAGRAEHERVHTQRVERRGSHINLYELPVFSRSLGITGFCDCVEARASENGGVSLPFGAESYVLYPVEYKHGVVRNEPEYRMQLCAQAISLEEQYHCVIPYGALFFIDAHRRDEVEFTQELRADTRHVAEQLSILSDNGIFPSAEFGAKCKKCSLFEHCQPKVRRSASDYCKSLWKEVQSEGKLK